jgi:hypothetical protein
MEKCEPPCYFIMPLETLKVGHSGIQESWPNFCSPKAFRCKVLSKMLTFTLLLFFPWGKAFGVGHPYSLGPIFSVLMSLWWRQCQNWPWPYCDWHIHHGLMVHKCLKFKMHVILCGGWGIYYTHIWDFVSTLNQWRSQYYALWNDRAPSSYVG